MVNASNATAKGPEYPFVANVLALACDVPVESVYVSQHLSLPEFLFTACMIVVGLTALSTLWSLFQRVEVYVMRRWKERKSSSKVAPVSTNEESAEEMENVEKRNEDTAKDEANKEPANEKDKDKEDTAKEEPETTEKEEEPAEDNKGDTEEESETAVEAAKQDMI